MNSLVKNIKDIAQKNLLYLFENTYISRVVMGVLTLLFTALVVLSIREKFSTSTFLIFEAIIIAVFLLSYSKKPGLREAAQFLSVLILFSVINAIIVFTFLAIFL